MKGLLNSKLKVITVVALLVVVAGFVLFGVLGFNATPDYTAKQSYELEVSVDANIGTAPSVLKTSTDEYLASKGVRVSSYSVEKLDDGAVYVYKFKNDVSDKIDIAELKAAIKEGLNGVELLTSVTPEANLNVRVNFGDTQWYIALALAIGVAATFIYALIFERISGALTISIVSIISGIVYFAAIGIVRLPAKPFFTTGLTLSVLLSAIISVVMVNRFNQTCKFESSKNLSHAEIAAAGIKASGLRVLLLFAAVAVLGALFLIVGPSYIRYAGAQILIADVVATVIAYAYSGFFWAHLGADGKKKKTSVDMSASINAK